MSFPRTESRAKTRDVEVQVKSQYIEEQSQPLSRRFVFAYTITITNHGSDVVQLNSRHWIITDAQGQVEEVRGPGVVGEQPVLRQGESFRYTSGAVLKTERGTMKGTYQMQLHDGGVFDAEIATFLLERPYSLN